MISEVEENDLARFKEYLDTTRDMDGLITGEESPYGLMVNTVDGEAADYGKDQSWWCLTKGGEWLDTGVDDTLIADGEHYEFTYTVG